MSDLYVKCPRCSGDRLVFAYTDRGSDYRPSQGEYFRCPLCSGTGEAEAELAAEWTADHEEDDQ
jgi:rubredoxin